MSVETIMERLNGYAGVRVIGDVHGDRAALSAAMDDARDLNLYPLLVGDIVDRGPDSVGCMEEVLNRLCTVLPGNHDAKFIRWLRGNPVQISGGLEVTKEQIEARPDGRVIGEYFAAMMDQQPLWLRLGRFIFAHAAVAPEMVYITAPTLAKGKSMDRLRSFALYGETDGTFTEEGFPHRTYGWFDQIPKGITAVIGHDAVPEIQVHDGLRGGRAILIDTGCGKGGKLSFLDIPMESLLAEPDLEPAPLEPLLTIMVGPSGAGKSTWTALQDPASVISTDEIRRELYGDHVIQGDYRVVFQIFFSRAQARLAQGLPVVLDATHLHRRDRIASVTLVPPNHPVRYVVIDRPLAEKIRDGGWRLAEKDEDGEGLIERHDRVFKSGVSEILRGDGLPNVQVIDARSDECRMAGIQTMAPAKPGKSAKQARQAASGGSAQA